MRGLEGSRISVLARTDDESQMTTDPATVESVGSQAADPGSGSLVNVEAVTPIDDEFDGSSKLKAAIQRFLFTPNMIVLRRWASMELFVLGTFPLFIAYTIFNMRVNPFIGLLTLLICIPGVAYSSMLVCPGLTGVDELSASIQDDSCGHASVQQGWVQTNFAYGVFSILAFLGAVLYILIAGHRVHHPHSIAFLIFASAVLCAFFSTAAIAGYKMPSTMCVCAVLVIPVTYCHLRRSLLSCRSLALARTPLITFECNGSRSCSAHRFEVAQATAAMNLDSDAPLPGMMGGVATAHANEVGAVGAPAVEIPEQDNDEEGVPCIANEPDPSATAGAATTLASTSPATSEC